MSLTTGCPRERSTGCPRSPSGRWLRSVQKVSRKSPRGLKKCSRYSYTPETLFGHCGARAYGAHPGRGTWGSPGHSGAKGPRDPPAGWRDRNLIDCDTVLMCPYVHPPVRRSMHPSVRFPISQISDSSLCSVSHLHGASFSSFL